MNLPKLRDCRPIYISLALQSESEKRWPLSILASGIALFHILILAAVFAGLGQWWTALFLATITALLSFALANKIRRWLWECRAEHKPSRLFE